MAEPQEYLVHHIQDALATDPRARELGVDVHVAGDRVVLTGTAATPTQRVIYPFLGSHLLAEAIDTAGADLVVHGHAHNGSERGVTPGGIRVRNVAQPVIQRAYRIYDLGEPTAREAPVAATG